MKNWERTVRILEENFKGKETELLELTDWFCENYKRVSENIKLSEFIEATKVAGVKVV